MKRLLFLLSVLLFLLSCSKQEKDENDPLPDLTKYVDPQIGSVHGRWFFYTPAARPSHGQISSHTNAYKSEGGWGPTGYDDRHTSIEGFGHFHEFQIGGLVFMPPSLLQTIPGSLMIRRRLPLSFR